MVRKKILVFSPQPWGHIFISKHHYALELSKDNEVYFISAAQESLGTGSNWTKVSDSLSVLDFSIPVPNIIKFKWPALYKQIWKLFAGRILSRISTSFDVIIDFGCYQFYDSNDFITAKRKIYFPVDDYDNLTLSNRGCREIFSVSINLIEKFKRGGLNPKFINHGLSVDFAKIIAEAKQETTTQVDGKIRIGYAGNLYISFLDVPVFMNIIRDNPDIEFHLFGNSGNPGASSPFLEWYRFISTADNVKLRGLVSPSDLAREYKKLDGFILCYKPDYLNYHAENSHKVFEYLSTGKVLISTYLSIYDGSPLIEMSPKDQNEELQSVFKRVVSDIDLYNTEEIDANRKALAFENTYDKQAARLLS